MFGLGFYAPLLYVKNVAGKRLASIMSVFPDALDLLLICVESGMSVEAAIQKVAAEVGVELHRAGGGAEPAQRRAQLSARAAHGL